MTMVTQNAPEPMPVQPMNDHGRPDRMQETPSSTYDVGVFGRVLFASLIGLALARMITQAGWV